MTTAFRLVLAAPVVMLLGFSEARSEQPKPKSVPGTGQPAFRQPYSVPGTGQPAFTQPSIPGTGQPYYPSYNYRYSYPYQSYHSGPYRSVPGTGIPAYPPQSYPYPTWRLGITGYDWPGVGVHIASIEPGGPAERMGIEVTDVIVQINGRPIRSMYDLRNALSYSNGYVRVLVLDNRTNSYMWHNGTLFQEPVAAPGTAVPAPGAASPMDPMPMPATPGTPSAATPSPGAGN